MAGDTLEVAKALKIIQQEGPKRGLHLNIKKTEIFWPSPDPRSRQEGVFPVDIGRPSRGVKLLGGPVSLDLQFCSDMVVGRVDKTIQLMQRVQLLYDPQCELLLLRNCTGVSKLYFTLRTTCPDALQEAIILYDQHLYQYLRQLTVGDGAGFGLVQQRLATLPIKDGGFGVYTMADTSKYCYLASNTQTKYLQESILQCSSPADPSPRYEHALQTFMQACGLSSSNFSINNIAPHPMKSLAMLYFAAVKDKLPTSFDLSERESLIWQCNRRDHAMDFLKAVPISGLNQAVAPRQFRSVLMYRLAIPFFVKDCLCSVCSKPMDIYADHAVHCASDVGVKFKHDMARDGLADMIFKAGVLARKEFSLGFRSDDAKDLKPADIFIYNWEDGKDVCFDVTGVSPFTTARTQSFTPCHAINAAVRRKCSKYLDKCAELGYGFKALAFSTFGELGDDLIVFLKRLGNCLVSHDANFKIGNYLFHRLGIVIQKGVGAQIVARLPTTAMY